EGGGMMRMIVFAAAIALASPAFAQPAVDADKLAAARELIKTADLPTMMRAMGPRVAESLGEQIRQTFAGHKMPAGLGKPLTAAIQASVASMDTAFTPELIDRLAMAYAQHFSTADLRHLAELMQDPVMKRYRAEAPGIMADWMPMVFEAMKPRQQALQAKLK